MSTQALLPHLGIVNGNTRGVYESAYPVPDVRETLNNWLLPLALVIVEKKQVDFETVETYRPQNTRATIQPLGPTRLEQKAEGERSWEWLLVHAAPDLVLKNDDAILIHNKRYRVMHNRNYSVYGYMEYEIIRDYQGVQSIA